MDAQFLVLLSVCVSTTKVSKSAVSKGKQLPRKKIGAKA